MKNTIYNAIQKQLVFDDNDSSISYKHSEINSDLQLMTLDQANDIYNKQKNEMYGPRIHDIMECNLAGCLVYIMKDNSIVPVNEYEVGMGMPAFLKMSSPELIKTNNEILIACTGNHHHETAGNWKYCEFKHDIFIDEGYNKLSSEDMLAEKAASDINGYEKCLKLYQMQPKYHLSGFSCLGAVTYCMNLTINNNGAIYKGYLPAIGQMMILSRCCNMVNHLFTFSKCQHIKTHTYWSCSEFDDTYALTVNDSEGNIFKNNKGTNYIWTLPFFKKIN